MKRGIKLSALIIVITCQGVLAQVSLDTLLSRTSDNNQSLLAASRLYEAEVIASKVGNSPPNPEVEYGYMWGSPDILGDRVDFAVYQSFDFPTVYTSQSKLSKINSDQAELKLIATRQNILARAHQGWIDAVYLNMKLSMLQARLKNAQQVNNAFRRKYETGEANQLQLNQALLQKTMLNNELSRTQVAIQNNQNLLKQLAGGKTIIISDTLLPAPVELILDTLLEDYRNGAMNMWYQREVEKRDQEKDVIFNRKLPKLMAGYYSEYILNTKLRGIKAGISIPLWGNTQAVKSAKAGKIFAESDAWRFHSEQETGISNMFRQWESLKAQVEELNNIFNSANNENLLFQSMAAGEISLTQYFYESDFFFQSKLAMLESRRDLLRLEADLMKVYY